MSYITDADILDDDLEPLCKDADFTEADSWFVAFARGQNVPESSIKDDPLPWECKRALVFWVCCEVARRSIGKNISIAANGNQTDFYLKKLENYQKELSNAITACTYNVITGTVTYADDSSESVTTIERA